MRSKYPTLQSKGPKLAREVRPTGWYGWRAPHTSIVPASTVFFLPERPAPSEGRQITRPAWLHPTLFTVRRKGAEGEHSAGASARPS